MLEKLVNESSGMEAEHQARMIIAEESLRKKKTCVERLERELATEVKKRRQLVPDR